MKENEPKNFEGEQADGRGADETPSRGESPKIRSKSLQKHIVVCPHCGAEALDHMTKCPECKGELQPKGYRPFDRDGLRRFRRIAWIVTLAIAVVIVALIFVRGN